MSLPSSHSKISKIQRGVGKRKWTAKGTENSSQALVQVSDRGQQPLGAFQVPILLDTKSLY